MVERPKQSPLSNVFGINAPQHIFTKIAVELWRYQDASSVWTKNEPFPEPLFMAFNLAVTIWHMTDWLWMSGPSNRQLLARKFGFAYEELKKGGLDMQQLLRRMKKDHLILIMSMHGHLPDEVELDEVLRITPKVAALIDSEKNSPDAELEPKRKDFIEMFKTRGLQVHVLERRATENYFTDEAVKMVFGVNFRALLPYEKIKDVTPNWGKNRNWLLALPSAGAIDQTDLGQFLLAL